MYNQVLIGVVTFCPFFPFAAPIELPKRGTLIVKGLLGNLDFIEPYRGLGFRGLGV